MSTAIAFEGRLPGVRCDPALPRQIDDAIRLDVAAFVGFAERGPVDDPQLVEDPAQYVTLFGGDLPLALDEKGVPTYAALPDAARSFFDNGGRRCWVVRVVGDDAVRVEDVPVRITSRIPLGDGLAVVGLGVSAEPLPLDLPSSPPSLTLRAATPGGWGTRLAVDVDVFDTVLGLHTGPAPDNDVELVPASKHLLDPGDAVLLQRPGVGSPPEPVWDLLWVPDDVDEFEPEGGWQQGDVVRLLRAELTVKVVDDDDVFVAVERIGNLRLGPSTGVIGSGRSASWTDVLQPADGTFARNRSMYLRAPEGAALVPVLGPMVTPVPDEPDLDVAPAFSRAALAADGLDVYDPGALFCDPRLAGQRTVEALRRALELLELEDVPDVHGLHTVALVPEVAILAVPDLYHRGWHEEIIVVEPDPDPDPDPDPEPEEPIGFHVCEPPPVDPGPPTPPPTSPTVVRRMVVDLPQDYDPASLLEVATCLVDLCAARADMITVLGLPRHAGIAEAQLLADRLASRRAATTDVPSYAGIWHPWGAIPEQRTPTLAPLRPVPLDGAVVGTIAATELARGVWVEPAGWILAGVVGLDSLDPALTLALFDRGLNPVRRRPAGFAATAAHSVSPDRTLLQLSVRRLLILVRKLALREGNRLVFEPDNERFRAQVEATFMRVLERLRVSGALHAYQVVVEPLATRTLADEGKVRIDLKLAPTSPIEFVTVTLLRAGEGLLQVQGS
jgi:Bacteriophage tail sheath protein